jgi:hypothetical protein
MRAGILSLVVLLVLISTQQVSAQPHSILEAPQPDDLARNLVDVYRFETLEQMRSAGVENVVLANAPWAGWYWPLSEGGMVNRYADPAMPSRESSWDEVYQFLTGSLGRGNIAQLSPAEKYDLLIGDPQFSISRAMLETANEHASGGAVESWFGYCAGWANASVMLARPQHAVNVLAADGQTWIPFRPSDIKALAALLWTNGVAPARVVGTLCQENPVRRDPSTGRADSLSCRNTNPATFHLAVTNQLGAAGRSLLIDSDSGYQVWNQPVLSYSYSYFHPATGKAGSLEESRVRVELLPQDPFRLMRAPGTAFVVGIETRLTFVYQTRPRAEDLDNPAWDELRNPVYRYELELDASGKIIGGEWLVRLHPDVLWLTPVGTRPMTKGDALVISSERWEAGAPLPNSWLRAARVSAQQVQPLGEIIQKLIEWSRQ